MCDESFFFECGVRRIGPTLDEGEGGDGVEGRSDLAEGGKRSGPLLEPEPEAPSVSIGAKATVEAAPAEGAEGSAGVAVVGYVLGVRFGAKMIFGCLRGGLCGG